MSFNEALATTFVSLNIEPCMDRPTFIDLNPFEVTWNSFMISLDKYNGSGNVVDDLSTKICVLSKTKDLNVKVFDMITTINETKTLMKHISFDCK